ncbi:MAG: diguanylate cyclase [Schwartzia succinivorans]|nr:diguanylate cyclase [Schwartzia succinivorans]
MMKDKHISDKKFILTAVIGGLLVMAIVIGTTLWASKETAAETDEAVAAVSHFYLQAMADRRARIITNLINNNFEHMEKLLPIIAEENIDSQETLRAVIGKIKTLLSLKRFALVDEDNVVYTQYTTYTGGSRHAFLNADKLNKRDISTVYLYGSAKQLCLAIPTEGLVLFGKPFKACFVQIDIEEIASLLAFDGPGRTYFGLYDRNGVNLSNTNLGSIVSGQNILEATRDILSKSEWEQLCSDFDDEAHGGLTVAFNGAEETLFYVPIPDTGWMMVILIRESIINDQIRGISEKHLESSNLQIGVTLGSMLLFAAVLLWRLWKISRMKLEAEMKNSKAFQSMANTDALTGVRNKHAYSEDEAALNRKIMGRELEKLAVVVCDINGLKIVNDTKGHAAGDKLIKDASALLCEYFIHGAVYRIGGDEFVVLLQEKGYDTREAAIRSLNEIIEANIATDGVVISMGYSTLEPNDERLHDVFERADRMMYERKQELKRMGAKTREA